MDMISDELGAGDGSKRRHGPRRSDGIRMREDKRTSSDKKSVCVKKVSHDKSLEQIFSGTSGAHDTAGNPETTANAALP